jgi:SAM-dependent methyltransferase
MTVQRIHWTEAGVACSARWRSERGAPPPSRVILADDTMSADLAYRSACEGTALLWRGDFHQARQMLMAMTRRLDKPPRRGARPAAPEVKPGDPALFHRHRQVQAHRARVLGALLIAFEADHGVALRRAPDVREACRQAWGEDDEPAGPSVASLRELSGITSAHEWRRLGVPVPALGARIHPHYGVFSPVRGEYVQLVAQAPLPAGCGSAAADGAAEGPPAGLAFDIGTGSGVLAALLAQRGLARIVATDLETRALACAADNLARLGLADRVELCQADLFPPGRADLIVCNPPWLPARAGTPVERAVYDEGGRMLSAFLEGLAAHLAPDGEGWLIISDLAEHLGLRTRAALMSAIDAAGLRIVGRLDARPRHPKAGDAEDPLHAARAAELTSLWRLRAAAATE